MKAELISTALKQAIGRTETKEGLLVNSDLGVQYVSREYQALLQTHSFICSRSWKGNCYDNAPMDPFWGKHKIEWLNDYTFNTLEEPKKAVFEYIEVFYNRQRTHSTNSYAPPFSTDEAT